MVLHVFHWQPALPPFGFINILILHKNSLDIVSLLQENLNRLSPSVPMLFLLELKKKEKAKHVQRMEDDNREIRNGKYINIFFMKDLY